MIASDRRIRFQQNLSGRQLSILALSYNRWRLIREKIPDINAAIAGMRPGEFREVAII